MTHHDRRGKNAQSTVPCCNESRHDWPIGLDEWLHSFGPIKGPQKTANQGARELATPPDVTPSRDLLSLLASIRHLQGGRLSGRAPQNVLISGTGNSSLALSLATRYDSAVVIYSSEETAEVMKGIPLASKGSILRTLDKKGRRALELRDHAVRPGIEFRHASPEQTGLAASSFDMIIIEQAHRYDLRRLQTELRRIARPGSTVVYVGYMLPDVTPRVNDAMKSSFEALLKRYLSQAEKQLLRGFEQQSFPFAAPQTGTYFGRRPTMQARWSATDLLSHINDWPVVRRLELAMFEQQALWKMRDMLIDAWGPTRGKRDVRLPAIIRSGNVE